MQWVLSGERGEECLDCGTVCSYTALNEIRLSAPSTVESLVEGFGQFLHVAALMAHGVLIAIAITAGETCASSAAVFHYRHAQATYTVRSETIFKKNYVAFIRILFG